MMSYEDYGVEHLNKIEAQIAPHSEMTREEREFVNGLVRYHKPKKILEVGISAGASSLILLNAGADYGAQVHSVDYAEAWYQDYSKKTGFLVGEQAPDLAAKWNSYIGTISARFMDQIGSDIDFCLIDTTHCNPGEFLDFLMVLPYLKEDAIVVLHDVGIHTVNYRDENFDMLTTCSVLYSVLRGKRLLPSRTSQEFFANIGAVKLTPTSRDDLWAFFNLLTLPWINKWSNWNYLLPEEWSYLEQFVARHYPIDLSSFFQKIILYKDTRKNYEAEKKNESP